MARPFAYLRKSVIRRDQHTISPETQEAEVRRLAAYHGDDGDQLAILADWDISGRKAYTGKRREWLRLVEAVESGEASAVYSYSLSRLSRSASVLSEFFDLCAARHVPIRLAKDSVDTSTASGRMMAGFLAQIAQFESDIASERVNDMYATKRANGEPIRTSKRYGERDGDDEAAVLAAFDEAGTYSGAARLLNTRGVRSRNGGERGWWASSVRVVVQRLRPEIAARPASRGIASSGSAFRLARLLRCPTCGSMLTGSNLKWKGHAERRARYACRFAESKPHPRVAVSEHLILPAIMAEVARLRRPRIDMGDGDEAERAKLDARRQRILDLYVDGEIDKAERDRRLAAVRDGLAALDGRRVVFDLPPIDWDADPASINAYLRAVFERIDLDPETFQPVAFEWAVPEWRSPVVAVS